MQRQKEKKTRRKNRKTEPTEKELSETHMWKRQIHQCTCISTHLTRSCRVWLGDNVTGVLLWFKGDMCGTFCLSKWRPHFSLILLLCCFLSERGCCYLTPICLSDVGQHPFVLKNKNREKSWKQPIPADVPFDTTSSYKSAVSKVKLE